MKVAVSPPGALATAAMVIPLDFTGVSPPSGFAGAGATAPAARIGIFPPAGGASASAFTPFYGGGLVSTLTSAQRALLLQQVVIEAELIAAEAALAAATTANAVAAARANIDHHAARFTYCVQALEEIDRALTLSSMFDPIGA
jgi:hypothetical protein